MKSYSLSIAIVTERYSLDEISPVLGLAYSSTSHDLGSRRGKGTWNQTIWRLESGAAETASLVEHIESLRSKFSRVNRQQRDALGENCRWLLEVAVYFDTAMCSIEMPRSVAELLTELDLELTLSCYPSDFSKEETASG